MTDKLIERLSPYAVDGGFDAYGQMEADEFGDYVRFEGYQARILADAKIIEAADELARRVVLQGEGAPMRAGYVKEALAAYRAAVSGAGE